jgi:hypothetical protein
MATEPVSEVAEVKIPRQRGPVEDAVEDAIEAPPARNRARWLGPLAAVLGYAVLRGIGLVFLAVAAANRGHRLQDPLLRADAGWYLSIVEHGYNHVLINGLDGQLLPTNLAFFPLYPAATFGVHWLFHISPEIAALAVAWAAGLIAAGGLYAVGTVVKDRGTGVMLALLWAVLPHAMVQSMGYSETLFTALTAWSLWAVLRKHWLTAGLLCVLAGLTRPTASALIAAVGLAALVTVIRDWRQWRAWIAGLISPLGLLGYMWWVGRRLHRTDAYFYVQDRAWHMTFDDGYFTYDSARRILYADQPMQLAITVTTLVLATSIILLLTSFGARLPWPLLVFGAVAVIVVLTGDGYYYAKARLLMPVFTLLLPAAAALARTRNRMAPIAVIAVLTVLSSSYGIYLGMISKHSP